MSMPRPRLTPLQDAMERLKSDHSDLATDWRQTKSEWPDAVAEQFEQQHLQPIGPTLSRLSTALADLIERVRHAEKQLSDPCDDSP